MCLNFYLGNKKGPFSFPIDQYFSMRDPKELPRLLDHLPELADQFSKRPPLLFLDFDGTLSPIVDERDAARIDPEIKRYLSRLATRLPLLAVISGRDLRDVRQRVGIDGIYYMGSHGFETSGPAQLQSQQPEAVQVIHQLDKAEKLADNALRGRAGVEVERKRFAIAIHFRKAGPKAGADVRRTVQTIVDENEGLRHTTGKMIEEIRPDVEWDKGKALLWLCEELGLSTRDYFPLYLGDDITDEDAYREIKDIGAGVQVGEHGQPSQARYFLKNIEEVAHFLKWLHERIPAEGFPS